MPDSRDTGHTFVFKKPDLHTLVFLGSLPDTNVLFCYIVRAFFLMKKTIFTWRRNIFFDFGKKLQKSTCWNRDRTCCARPNELLFVQVEVHKNACGALQNLSFGKGNIDNKRWVSFIDKTVYCLYFGWLCLGLWYCMPMWLCSLYSFQLDEM